MAVHLDLGIAIPKFFWITFPGETRNLTTVLKVAVGAIAEADILSLLRILDFPHPLLV